MTNVLLNLLNINKINNLGQDLYNDLQPQFSFFKYVLRRNTNFFSGNINIYNNTANITNLDRLNLDIKLKDVINGDIDLLSDLYISFYLPDIYSNSKYKFKWVENIGALLIKEAIFTINSIDIDSFTGEWLCVWNELTSTNKDTFNKMTGNGIDINNPRTSENIIRIKNNIISDFDYPSSDKNNPNNPPSIPGKWISVQLPFWFTKAPNLALPIFGNIWQNNEFNIKISFENIEKLYTIYSDVYNMNVSPSYYNSLHNDNISIENFLKNNNILINIITTVILVDVNEKISIDNSCKSANGLIFLYEKVKKKTKEFEPLSTALRTISIEPGFLIKEILWTLRRSDCISKFNDTLNYSYNIPFNNENSILKKASIDWEGLEFMIETDSYYYNKIQPYQYHNAMPKQGIYIYSFSLLPSKSIHSGSYNSSYNSKDGININMHFNEYKPSVLDNMYQKKFNNSYINNNTVNIESVLYIIEHNFLQISQYIIGLRFSS